MLNLIKMNLYRVMRTKCVWILLLITAAMCILSVYLEFVDQNVKDFESSKPEISQEEESREILVPEVICGEM